MKLKALFLLLCIVELQLLTAANFNLINDTDHDIQVSAQWADTKQPFVWVKKGKSQWFETGFNAIQYVFWQEQLPPTDDDRKNNRYCAAHYATGFLDISPIATGGIFKVKPDGRFTFDFTIIGGHRDEKIEPQTTCTIGAYEASFYGK